MKILMFILIKSLYILNQVISLFFFFFQIRYLVRITKSCLI